MRYVLDASVAVAALRDREALHERALRRCMPFFAGRDVVVVPTIFDLELTSALVRRGVDPARVDRFFEQHLVTRERVTIGPRAVGALRRILATTQLRAADAIYVWVAAREGLDLVTADDEVLRRAPLAGVNAVAP